MLNWLLGIPHCCIFVGFKFQITSPLHVLHGILSPADTKATKNGALDEDGPVSETRTETIPVADRKSVASGISN